MAAGNRSDPLKGVSEFIAGGSPLGSLGALEDFVDTANVSFIGRGGSGVVLLANEKNSHKQLAVKVLALVDACKLSSGVRREVKTMYELESHPSLVQLFGVFVYRHQLLCVDFQGPYLCVVMNYVSNVEPLSKIIRRGGSQPGLAARIVPQLASALAVMHRCGKVHRDVWSENVLVGECGKVVLVDFGNAEDFKTGPDTCAPVNIPYASPEAAKRLRQHPADDSWALGLLISEMLTGRFAVERLESPTIPIHYNKEVMNQLLREIAVHGSSSLGKVCCQLLDMNATKRLSMHSVVSALGGRRTPGPPALMRCPSSQMGEISRQNFVDGTQANLRGCSPLPAASRPAASRGQSPLPAPSRPVMPRPRCTSEQIPCSSSRARSESFCPGTPIEYESQSADGCWVEATVLAYHPDAGLYDLDCKASVSPSKIRGRDSFPIGSWVEYKSSTQNLGWVPGQVLTFDAASGRYDLSCKAGAPRGRMRFPSGMSEELSNADQVPRIVSYEMGSKCVQVPRIVSYEMSSDQQNRLVELKNRHDQQARDGHSTPSTSNGLNEKFRSTEQLPRIANYEMNGDQQYRPSRYDQQARDGNTAASAPNGVATFLAGGSPRSSLIDIGDALDESDAVLAKTNFSEALFLGCKLSGSEDLVVKAASLGFVGFATDILDGIRHEVKVLSTLSPHPNIAKLVAVSLCGRQLQGVSLPCPYLCTAIQGVGTMQLIHDAIKGGVCQGSFCELIILQLAYALASVHQQGFVHRNVSSETVLVNNIGQVLLFGFTAAQRCEAGPTRYASINMPYMSPEASNRSRQHPAEDCWALGLLISEMLTGRSISERVGDSSVPIHCKQQALNELMSDISPFKTARVGSLCAQLLVYNAADRMTMPDVVSALYHPEGNQDPPPKSHDLNCTQIPPYLEWQDVMDKSYCLSSTKAPSSAAPSSASSQVSTPLQVLR